MSEYIQVITTVDSLAEAQKIARALVEKRLAGCVQILGPISSTYWWDDEIVETEEYMCLIKTRRDLFTPVEGAIKAIHPYDVPEILAVPVSGSSQSYLDWLNGELVSRRE